MREPILPNEAIYYALHSFDRHGINMYTGGMDKVGQIKQYSKLLPERINVHSEGSPEEGFWAKITAPGSNLQNCYTEAKSIPELILMINEAIKTHYEIPEELRDQVSFYAPIPENHLRWEEMFNQLASMGNQEGEINTFLKLVPALVN